MSKLVQGKDQVLAEMVESAEQKSRRRSTENNGEGRKVNLKANMDYRKKPTQRKSVKIGFEAPKSPTRVLADLDKLPDRSDSVTAKDLLKNTTGKALGLSRRNDPTMSSKTANVCELLGLKKKDIRYLKKRFDAADKKGKGEIPIEGFFKMIGEEETSFTNALFELIDADKSGTIDFEEYVQVLTSYCIYSQEDLLYFIFSYFDNDHSGGLDEQEFIDMCCDINADAVFPGSLMKAFQGFDINDDGIIDFNEFKALNSRFPMLMFPAFRLQDQMQRCTLGLRRWRKVLEYKAKREVIEAYKLANNGELPPSKSWCACM